MYVGVVNGHWMIKEKKEPRRKSGPHTCQSVSTSDVNVPPNARIKLVGSLAGYCFVDVFLVY